MKSISQTLRAIVPTILTIGAALLLPPAASRAADHADAPALAQDQGADIADAFLFLDPNDNNNVIIIGTVHGFIVPGEAGNVAAFDSNIKYRFEIFNKHVNLTVPVLPASPTAAQKAAYNKAKAVYLSKVAVNKSIDVTFSKFGVPPDPAAPKHVGDPDLRDPRYNLAKPGPQTATVTLTGFPGVPNRGVIKKQDDGLTDITTTPASLGVTAAGRTTNPLAVVAHGPPAILFFAGIVDDPFFFDVVGFSRVIKSIHDGATDLSNLGRGRDTFAGYNILAIALSIPKSLLVDPSGPVIGLDFLTQRHAVQLTGADGFTGSGAYKTVDRIGNPAVNTALIPFNKKNAYNASTVKLDASGKFVGDIATTIGQLGLGTDPDHIGALVGVAVARGDILQLNTGLPNGDPATPSTQKGGGSGLNGFPNGRRLKDDTIDIILSILANGATVGDGVDSNEPDFPILDSFPFLPLPHQPLSNPVTDDDTRN